MAKNSTASTTAPVIPAAPEGFRRLGSVANAGWFNLKQVGNTIHGVLEGMYERKDDMNPEKKSKFFQVRVLSGHPEVRMGRGEEADLEEAGEGEYVNLNYGPKTRDLEKYIPEILQGAVYEVYGAVLGEKIKLQGGRTMHNFDVQIKMVKAVPAKTVEDDFVADEVF